MPSSLRRFQGHYEINGARKPPGLDIEPFEFSGSEPLMATLAVYYDRYNRLALDHSRMPRGNHCRRPERGRTHRRRAPRGARPATRAPACSRRSKTRQPKPPSSVVAEPPRAAVLRFFVPEVKTKWARVIIKNNSTEPLGG